MTQLLTTIRQEIERLEKYYAECGYPGMGKYEQGNKDGRLDTLDYFRSFLDSLAVDAPEVDLEKEIDSCWQSWLSPSNQSSVEGVLPKSEFAMYARHFYELRKNAK